MKLIPPNEPFEYLGIKPTLSLNWTHQFEAAKTMIITKGEKILSSPATMHQRLMMEEQCVFTALLHAFNVTPYTPTQLNALEKLRSRLLKNILSLPWSTCTALLFLPATSLGCNLRSLIPAYVQVAGQSLATSLTDKGRLGTIARAIHAKHICRITNKSNQSPCLSRPEDFWRHSQMKAMCLRRAAWLTAHGMHITDPPPAYSLTANSADLQEVANDCVRWHTINVSPHDLYEQMLIPLWRLGVHHLQQLIEHHPQGQNIISRAHFSHKWPAANADAIRALHLFTTIIKCTRTASEGARGDASQNMNLPTPTHRRIPHIFNVPHTTPHSQANDKTQVRTNQGTQANTTTPNRHLTHDTTRTLHKPTRHHGSHLSTTTGQPRQTLHMTPTDNQRLAQLMQIEKAGLHSDTRANPFQMLSTVTWRDTCRISAVNKRFLIKHGFVPHAEYDFIYAKQPTTQTTTTTDTPQTPKYLPLYTSVAWEPTDEFVLQIITLWPSQTQPYLLDRHADEPQLIQTLKHPKPDLHTPLQGIPPSLTSKINITIHTEETNPDMDIRPIGMSTYLTLDTTEDTAHSYGTNGHYAGSLTLTRLYYLLIAHTRTNKHLDSESKTTTTELPLQHSPNTITNTRPSLSEAIHSLILRKDIHRPHKTTKTPLPNIALLHQHTIRQLATTFNIQNEWLTDPLTHCPYIQQYTSTDPDDITFGASIRPYSLKWTGSGLFVPTPTPGDTYKALKWAILSTKETEPVLNIGIIPIFDAPDGTTNLLKHHSVHKLCTLPKESGSGESQTPHAWHNIRTKIPKNIVDLQIILVYNTAGLAAHTKEKTFQTLQNRLREIGATATCWNLDTQTKRNHPQPIPFHEKPTKDPTPPRAYTTATTQVTHEDVMCPAHLNATPSQQRNLLRAHSTETTKLFPLPKNLVYTDASKRGCSITGAVTQPSTGLSHTLHIPLDPPHLHTVLYGELAAIHSAISIMNKPEYTGPQTIMTDCLVAIHLIKQALYYPERIRLHKHRIILQEIVHMLLTRNHALSIYKVRAHSGIAGNEDADLLAKNAHSEPTDTSSVFQTSQIPSIPTSWVHFDSNKEGRPATTPDTITETRPVNSLTTHIQSIALCHKTAHTLNNPTNSVLNKIRRLLEGGIDTTATHAIWNTTLLSAGELRIALSIRANRLWTTTRARRCLGATVITTTTCPHCQMETDDADHALNRCNLPEIIKLTKARHDDAAHLILPVIKRGQRGSHYIHSDARNKSKSDAPLRPEDKTSRKLPAAVLPRDQQPSFPDITMIDLPHTFVTQIRNKINPKSIPYHIRQQCTVDIVEIKYTYDHFLHDRVPDAIAQHEQLRLNLLNAGWGTVNIHPFIIGSAGTIRAESHDILNTCGITDVEQRKTLLRRIAIHSAKCTAAIVRTRLAHIVPIEIQDKADVANDVKSPPPSPRPPPVNNNTPSGKTDGTINLKTQSGFGKTPSTDPTPPNTSTPTVAETPSSLGHCQTQTQHTEHQHSPYGYLRKSSRKRKHTQRVNEMEDGARRALYPDSENNCLSCNLEHQQRVSDTNPLEDPCNKRARTSRYDHTTAIPDGNKPIPNTNPTDPTTHHHTGTPANTTKTTTNTQTLATTNTTPHSTHPGDNIEQHSKKRGAPYNQRQIPPSKRTKHTTPATHRPTNTTDQSPPTDDVTHLSQRAHKNSNYKRRAPLEPDQPPSPPKRLRLTLLQTPNSISQYQVLHPEQQSGTPFDRGKFQ